MRTKHFVFVPLSKGYAKFVLKRDRSSFFGAIFAKDESLTVGDMTQDWTTDEWAEAISICTAIASGTFTHPALEQIQNKSN